MHLVHSHWSYRTSKRLPTCKLSSRVPETEKELIFYGRLCLLWWQCISTSPICAPNIYNHYPKTRINCTLSQPTLPCFDSSLFPSLQKADVGLNSSIIQYSSHLGVCDPTSATDWQPQASFWFSFNKRRNESYCDVITKSIKTNRSFSPNTKLWIKISFALVTREYKI